MEGVEYLANKGILSLTNAWNPNPGSKLEGHRTPSADFLVHDLYRIDEERLPIFYETE